MNQHKTLYMAYTGDSGESLRLKYDQYADRCREAEASDITIDAMADMLDHDAENGNHHDFVGCHAKLAKMFLARCRCKPVIAKELMRDLCDVGGLHGMRE